MSGTREPTQGPSVSVLTPVLNAEKLLRRAAPAMLAQEFDGDVEFLFIDGDSDDGTRAFVESLAANDPRVKLLTNPARVTPAALNIGLHAARGDYVVRMDAHTVYPPGYIAAGVSRHEQGGVEHVSGPQIAVPYDEGSRLTALALTSKLGVGGASFRSAREEVEVDSGFTGMWRRSRVLELGGWDEEWVRNQDAELAARLRAHGGRIVCIPEMAGEYMPRNSLRGLAKQYREYGFYRAKTARRHRNAFRRSHALAPLVVLTFAGAIVLPRPLRALARLGVAVYATALVAESARVADDPRDAIKLPAVFAAMHLPWGLGFLTGLAASPATRHPPPATP